MIRQSCTYNALAHLVLLVDSVHSQYVVGEVHGLEPSLLVQQHDESTAGPVQPLPEQLLNGELILPNGHAVHKLDSRPEPVELCTLIDWHYSISRWIALQVL